MRVLGIDLAWGTVAETGVVALDPDGTIADAGWTCGVEKTVEWIEMWATADTLAFVDAPLLVLNAEKQRLCEKQVGQLYGRWKVSANSTNRSSPRLAGVRLREVLTAIGWRYDDGTSGPPVNGRIVSECYPYTVLVGAAELGYNDERPRYKRQPRGMPLAEWRPERACNCDELIRRLDRLRSADPPLALRSHPMTTKLLDEPSPVSGDRDYKHREDLIDAALAAWGGALWVRHGTERCRVLGAGDVLVNEVAARATIVAPWRQAAHRAAGGGIA
jgi:predicted RNase H-like nuclease